MPRKKKELTVTAPVEKTVKSEEKTAEPAEKEMKPTENPATVKALAQEEAKPAKRGRRKKADASPADEKPAEPAESKKPEDAVKPEASGQPADNFMNAPASEEPQKEVAPETSTLAPVETADEKKPKKAPAARGRKKADGTAKKASPATPKASAKKTDTKKEAMEKETVVPEVIKNVTVQFSGKSYSTEDLVKIARDVWKYDLGFKEDDFKNVDLYVKPEENTVYYVINGNVTGNFAI